MRLSVQIEFDKTLELTSSKSQVIAGRSPGSDFVIPHNSISRSHCHIEISDGAIFITDLNSSNGTYINNKRLIPHQKTLYPDDAQLVLGRLDCEISPEIAPTEEKSKPLTSTKSSRADASSTMRISRLDLNKPSLTLKMEKELKVKGPRNPVTDEIQNPKKRKKRSKLIPLVLLLIVASIQYWLIDLAMN